MTNIRTLFTISLVLLACGMATKSWSCSPPPGARTARTYAFNYVAEVVLSEKTQDPAAIEKRLPIPVLLRVLESEGPKPAAGEVLSVERRGLIGANCAGSEAITLRDYYVGAKLKVKTDNLRFADQIYYAD